jgi:sulfate transport system substrate-binding protein
VPVLDTGARGATVTFAERGIGDALIAWENEARLTAQEFGAGKFEVVMPSESILAEPSVAVVDAVAGRRGTQALAQAYLEYLYSPAGQELAAKHFFRPREEAVEARHADRFPPVRRFTIDEIFGGWSKAQAVHFGDGGEFDRLPKGGG